MFNCLRLFFNYTTKIALLFDMVKYFMLKFTKNIAKLC